MNMIEELIFSDSGLLMMGVLVLAVGYEKREKIKAWVAWNVTKRDYPVKIMVFKKRGDGYITRMDKGKKKTDKEGKDFYDTCYCGKIPRIEVTYMTADGWIVLKEIKPGQYIQVSMTDRGEGDVEGQAKSSDHPLSESYKGWYATGTKAKFRYKKMDAWSFVMPFLTLIIFIIGSLIIATYIWSPLVSTMNNIASSQASTAQSQAEMVKIVNNACYNIRENGTFQRELSTGEGGAIDRGEVPY